MGLWLILHNLCNLAVHHDDVHNHYGDIHLHLLSTNPVSALESAFATLQDVFDRFKQVQSNQNQLLVLNETLAQLLTTLNGRYENQTLVESQTEGSLDNLERCVAYILPLGISILTRSKDYSMTWPLSLRRVHLKTF